MARPTVKTASQLGYMRQAGLVVAKVHAALRQACAPGVTGRELDQIVYDLTIAEGARPNFLNYNGFSGSVCISVNDVVVHGIPDDTAIREGDIVSFDCGAAVRAEGKDWHADAAFTMIVGQARSPRQDELNQVTEKSMWAGVAAFDGARRVGEVGAAVEDYVDTAQYDFGWTPGIIEGYTGHGIGSHLHEDPAVYNYRTRGRSDRIRPGMAFCVEPMLVGGDIGTRVLDDDWAVVTVDGADASHWEHTVAIVPGGISVLTALDFGRAGLEPFGVVPVEV